VSEARTSDPLAAPGRIGRRHTILLPCEFGFPLLVVRAEAFLRVGPATQRIGIKGQPKVDFSEAHATFAANV
jgi:hypothetical protein